jgi:hypothetical protein
VARLSYPVGIWGSFLKIKVQGCESDHHIQLVPRSGKRGSMHKLPNTPLGRSASLVHHRDNCTLLPYLIKQRSLV